MPEVASSHDGISVLKVKTEIVIQLKTHHGHPVKGKYRSFEPVKLTVQAWRGKDGLPDKAHITATDVAGFHGGRTFPDTVRFDLVGCPQYKPVPRWIAMVIREFGYQDPIERIV